MTRRKESVAHRTTIAAATDPSAFALSRIHAQGWNAAKGLSSDDRAELDADRISALNPYAAGAEQLRWHEGFMQGIAK